MSLRIIVSPWQGRPRAYERLRNVCFHEREPAAGYFELISCTSRRYLEECLHSAFGPGVALLLDRDLRRNELAELDVGTIQ